ncbi:hypothetical protein CFK37_07980 [Virgibacillus phasianinus]|uniref:YtxH domain-containing protein n=1 Tax=Virgibacillus phasianinus TaxID=2017483 RepID=A0A220U1J0_9BACI|nr:YtxH domain-containing protein [Virgibacillus phasianinus]ASK62104.1 hypothetical protein CFK37_07980 [Virgibacillus phasianinus]
MAQQTVKNKAKSVIKDNKNVITASVLGGVLGSVTTLLLTPKSGKELRANVTEQAINAKDKTVVFSENAKAKLTDFKSISSEKSKSLTNKLKGNSNEQPSVDQENAKSELQPEETEITKEESSTEEPKTKETKKDEKQKTAGSKEAAATKEQPEGSPGKKTGTKTGSKKPASSGAAASKKKSIK